MRLFEASNPAMKLASIHELMLTGRGETGSLSYSATAGRGFAAFGEHCRIVKRRLVDLREIPHRARIVADFHGARRRGVGGLDPDAHVQERTDEVGDVDRDGALAGGRSRQQGRENS